VEEEFREFVAARSGALLRTAYLLAGDWATAEDLLQTALTKTYLAWKRLGTIEAVEPYTRRVLVNTATSWWRRRWHGERPTEVLPEQAGPDRYEETLERDALWRHVRALPVRQRAVLVLRFYEDLSEAQTAELLDIAPGTVKSQTSRALATLRARLGAEGILAALAGASPTVGAPAGPDLPERAAAAGGPVQRARAPDRIPDRGRPVPPSEPHRRAEVPEPEPAEARPGPARLGTATGSSAAAPVAGREAG
jgi:RNA polymerase sigma-70 factor (sigma-E family)